MSAAAYYKFLAAGRRATHGVGAWTPGRARNVHGALVACSNGIHFCRPDQLAYWPAVELWTFEDLTPTETCEHEGSKLVTRRGRIVERVEAWTPETAVEWAFQVADHAVRVTAGEALRVAGLDERAATLAGLPAIDASDAAWAANCAAWAAGCAAGAASDAAWAANCAAWAAGCAAGAASDAAGAARDAAWAASDAAWAANCAAWAARDAAWAAGCAAGAANCAAGAAGHAAWAASYRRSSLLLADILGIV